MGGHTRGMLVKLIVVILRFAEVIDDIAQMKKECGPSMSAISFVIASPRRSWPIAVAAV